MSTALRGPNQSQEMKHRFNSVDRALAILECFSRERAVLRVSDVSCRSKIDKSTCSRLMAKLAERGILSRVDRGEYALGLRLVELGAIVLSTLHLDERVRPILEALARVTGDAVQVSVPYEGSALVVASIDSPSTIKVGVPLGTRIPLYNTSAGKVLCAFREELMPVVQRDLAVARTASEGRVLKTFEEFATEVEQTRSRGYGVARDEFFLGQMSLSAPIFDYSARALGAVTVLVLPGLREGQMRSPIAPLLEAAAQMSASLDRRQTDQ